MSPMYEFESVSVSSFEAAELAATLTAKSAEGWDVAAIVTAGSDVVAYLRRASVEAKQDDDSAGGGATDRATEVGTAPAGHGGGQEGGQEGAESPQPTEPESSTSTSASDLLAADTPASSSPSDPGSVGWGATGTGATSASSWGSESGGAWGGSSQQAAPAPVAQPQTPAVPAGWYADPAGRFELRYWDGGAWTEHVSRAGQQYTDPPVA